MSSVADPSILAPGVWNLPILIGSIFNDPRPVALFTNSARAFAAGKLFLTSAPALTESSINDWNVSTRNLFKNAVYARFDARTPGIFSAQVFMICSSLADSEFKSLKLSPASSANDLPTLPVAGSILGFIIGISLIE